MKIIKINENVFKTEVLFIYDCGVKEVNKYLKKIGAEQLTDFDEKNDLGCLLRSKWGVYRIIYIRKFSKTRERSANLVHEIFHLVVRICEDKGVPIVPQIHTGHCGDESAAYLLEFYYNEIMRQIK